MPEPRSDPRRLAASALNQVLRRGRSIGSQVERQQGTLSPRDLRLFHELLAGGVRWLAFLDSVVERAANRSLRAIDEPLHNLLRLGAYQILFLDRVPARAAVHEAVEQAKRPSGVAAARFVNAVLRTVSRRPTREAWRVNTDDAIADLAVNQSHPEHLIRGWVEHFGEEVARNLLQANNQPKNRVSVLTAQGPDVAARLPEATLTRSALAPHGWLVEGASPVEVTAAGGYVQDEASQAAALVPPPLPGERVFDAAASPGGKTLSLLTAEPGIEVVAGDLRLERLSRLLDNLGRFDAQDRTRALIANAARPALREEAFDRVVFDAPCSGTGTLRKHPELKWRVTAEELGRLAELQLAGLRSLAPLVRAGGRLCYITCSIESVENQAVVDDFLRATDGWQLDELGPSAPLAHHVIGRGFWQALPADDHDGATVHVLRRL